MRTPLIGTAFRFLLFPIFEHNFSVLIFLDYFFTFKEFENRFQFLLQLSHALHLTNLYYSIMNYTTYVMCTKVTLLARVPATVPTLVGKRTLATTNGTLQP
jgi:hypothetical protein